MLDGEFELGVALAIWNERGLEWSTMFKDTLALVARPDHPLCARQPLAIRDIVDQPFIFREQGSGTRRVVARILQSQEGKESDLRNVAELGSNEAVKETIKAGFGLSMLSRRSVAEDISRGDLKPLVLEHITGERPFYLIQRKNRALPPVASAFADHLRQRRSRNSDQPFPAPPFRQVKGSGKTAPPITLRSMPSPPSCHAGERNSSRHPRASQKNT